MTRRPLHLVDPAPTEPPIDIYAAIKAERDAINWAAVHIRGDRSRPLEWADRITRKGWR